ncbi:MAG TPA: M1 family metallopeptidase [Gemmatimonadales bacterium]|nr:M1 family metallopeptidase [Gemmatimonadales bacterium]
MRPPAPLLILLLAPLAAGAQEPRAFTRADTLRGSNTPERAWWDVVFYDLHVRVTPRDSGVQGSNGITYAVMATPPTREMQIDLQAPLALDSVMQDGRHLAIRREGNAWFATLNRRQRAGDRGTVVAFYHGRFTATDPGRRGPFIWATDSLGDPWIATSDEEIGASSLWPLKDYPADEPDSQRIAVTVPDPMIDVSNGRLRRTTHNADSTTTFEWFVTEPINGYDVTINASPRYVHFDGRYQGEGGELTLDFWPLSYHLDTARAQFQQAQPMLACFEHWFGAYPWYADGYKLIETPYLGMEHQSGIAYGNKYLAGYLGRDLSGTGIGMRWDFIIVHESAHEWWGNSLSAQDHTEMWLHESFAMYAEGLYTACQQGQPAGERYLVGLRGRVKNDVPIVGQYGVFDVPKSQDRYYKGSNMLFTIQQIVDNDSTWRGILRGLQEKFRHRTVRGVEIEAYISQQARVDLGPVFTQYLRTTMIPVFEYRIVGATLSYRWANVVPGFAMPVRVTLTDPQQYARLYPTTDWQTVPLRLPRAADFRVDDRFYVTARDVAAPAAPSQ